MIFENQPATLSSSVTSNGSALDLTGVASVKYLYWMPGVYGSPSGEFTATIDDAVTGSISYNIPEDVLTPGKWYFRGVAVFANGEFPADDKTELKVYRLSSSV